MEPGTSIENTGPIANKTSRIPKNVFTFSTCSVEKGPPYLSLAKSSLEGMYLSPYVKALRRRGYLWFLTNFDDIIDSLVGIASSWFTVEPATFPTTN